MLLLNDPAPPFSAKRLQRLLFLERHLRQRVDNRATAQITTPALQELLLSAGIPAAGERTERRAVERDLEDYAGYCDDFVPTRQVIGSRPVGGTSVGYALDIAATDDAIRYFLGEPWLQAAVKPRLSSALARCLLLASIYRQEVEFGYRRVPKAGESWQAYRLRGVPLRTVPGLDSAYMQMLGEKGPFNINLARVTVPMFWTGQNPISDAAPFSEGAKTRLVVHFQSREDTQVMVETFNGLQREDDVTVSVIVPAALATMTADQLAVYLYRTRERPGEQNVYHLAGKALLVQQPFAEDDE